MDESTSYTPKHAPEEQKAPAFMLSNKAYDVLKPITQIVFPGLITLWLTLANIWSWGNVEEVAGTMGAINLFLGVLLGLSGRSYSKSDSKYDGVIDVTEDPETGIKQASLMLKNYENPADVVMQEEVLFKVNPQ